MTIDVTPAAHRTAYAPVRLLYLLEALASIAAVLLMTGIFFYTHKQFGWGLRGNLLLASGQGVIYIGGALSAQAASSRVGSRRMFVILQFAMTALALIALAFTTPLVVAICLLLYAGLSGGQWPILESMVSRGAGGEALSRRLAAYNVCWSATNAVTLAISGKIIQNWPAGVFILVAICNTATGILMQIAGPRDAAKSAPAPRHEKPEPELLPVRTQALWLSRIALPSTYVVVYSLSAMLPSLPVINTVSTQWATVLGSVWFVSRCVTFAVLGFTRFWHTRPRLMLVAAFVMLFAFLGVTLRPSELFPALSVSWQTDLLAMIVAQLILGTALGTIYSASLYFGMVLSDGSTEHGGYHEALIGMGSVLGPGSAFLADVLRPAQIDFAIAAVAGLIGLSLVAAIGAVLWGKRRE